jgi:hypothetical protein
MDQSEEVIIKDVSDWESLKFNQYGIFTVDNTDYRVTPIVGGWLLHEWKRFEQEYIQPGTYIKRKL